MTLRIAFALLSFLVWSVAGFITAQDTAKPAKKVVPGMKEMTFAGSVVDASGMVASEASVHLQNALAEVDEQAVTNTQGQFELTVKLHPNNLYGLRFQVTSKDKTQVALHRIPFTEDGEPLKSIAVRLEQVKTAKLKVVDGAGKPIAGASAALLAGYPNMLGPAKTDAKGECSFNLPESARIDTILAWKAGAGLDYELYTLPYEQANDQLTKTPEFPIELGETLTLTGASPLTVRVTDTDDKSIPGAKAYVWLLNKTDPKRREELNLSYFTEMFRQEADDNGKIVFDWFPIWQTDPVTIWPMVDGYVHVRGQYEPATKTNALNISLERLVPMRGKVSFADGKPAAKITVAANGSGYDIDRYNATVETDEQGRYEFKAAPNQIYMISIADKEWAAPSQSGFVVLPGKEVADHDFVLRKSTRVFGRVLNEDTGEPVPDKRVYLTHHGIDLQTMKDVVLPNPRGSTTYVCPMTQQTINTGEDGKFEFFVGEGEYKLFIQGSKATTLSIAQEAEKPADIKIYVQPQKTFTGLAIDGQSSFPLAGVHLDIHSANLNKSDQWKATTAADGIFQVKMFSERSFVHAVSADSKLGAILELDADRESAELKLKPLGSATGKLLTVDGSQPAAGVKLLYGVTIFDKASQMSSNRFGRVVTTDSDGVFTLPNLVPDWEYTCTLLDYPGGYVLTVVKANVEPGETRKLGDVKTPEPPKRYVPPTLEERIEQAFTVAGTPLERFARAKQTVKHANQNLLIILSEIKDSRTASLMEWRFEDADYRSYADDFRTMCISTDADKIDEAKELAKSLELPELQAEKNFLLIVVNRDGEVVAKIKSDQVCDGDKLSKNRLLTELDKYKTTPLDARELLTLALAKAERENKRVLLQETATWCGPCHMLTRWLLANKQWETDYIWLKMDHRWTGAIEIMKEYRGEAQGGIPWCVILDAKGNKLATSNHLKSGDNIGFPSDADGQKHFAHMFKLTRIRMTDEEIEELTKAAGKE